MQESGGGYGYFEDIQPLSKTTQKRKSTTTTDTSKMQYDYGVLPTLEEAPPALTLGDYVGVNSSDESMSFKSNSVFGLNSRSGSAASAGDFDTLPLVGRKVGVGNPHTPSTINHNGTHGGRNSSTVAGASTTGAAGAKTNAYNPFKDFDFMPLNESRSPQKNTGNGARTTNDAGFNFGIETFLHGFELGFGRQPSFKRLTTTDSGSRAPVVGSSVTSTAKPSSPRRPSFQTQHPPGTDNRKKDSIASVGTNARNRRSSLLPGPFPPSKNTTTSNASYTNEVDLLLKGYLDANAKIIGGAKNDTDNTNASAFDLEAFLNRDPNMRSGPSTNRKTPKTLDNSSKLANSRLSTPASALKKMKQQLDDPKDAREYSAFNYLDGMYGPEGSQSATSPGTIHSASHHSSWKKIPPPTRPKESTIGDNSRTASFSSITDVVSHTSSKQNHSKPMMSVQPILTTSSTDSKIRPKSDAQQGEYVLEDLGNSSTNMTGSVAPLFPTTTSTVPTITGKSDSPSTSSRKNNEAQASGNISPQPGGILQRPSIGQNRNPSTSFNAGKRASSINRNMNEFKPGGEWRSSFSKRKPSAGMGADESTSDKNRRMKEEQLANEARKERVKAFMEKRKQQKAEEEALRAKLAEREREVQKRTDMKRRQEIAASLDLTGGSGVKMAKAVLRQRQNHKSPDRKRQSLPEAPYLKEEQTILALNREREENFSHDRDTVMSRTKRDTQVKSVVVFVNSGKPNADCISMSCTDKEKSILEVKYGKDIPRYFNVDEFLSYRKNGDKIVASSLIAEVRKKFISGVNTAIFLSATESAEVGLFIAIREIIEDIFSSINSGAELFLSVSYLCGGLCEDLLSDSGRLERTTFSASPHFGVTLDNVGYVKINDQQQFTKLVADGYKTANYSKRSQQSSGIIVLSLLLKQVKKNDVILSSLLITDAGVNVTTYRSVLRRADNVPFPLFYGGPLGGPTYTVSVLAVSEEDSTSYLQALHTQHCVCSIVNKPNHIGSVSRFVELAEAELSNANASLDAAKRRNLEIQVAEARSLLKDPVDYVLKPSPQDLIRSRRNTQKETNTPASAFPVCATRPQPKSLGKKTSSRGSETMTGGNAGGDEAKKNGKQHQTVSRLFPSHQKGSDAGSVTGTNPIQQRLSEAKSNEANINRNASTINEGYVNRNAKSEGLGFINLDETETLPPAGQHKNTNNSSNNQPNGRNGSDLSQKKVTNGGANKNNDNNAGLPILDTSLRSSRNSLMQKPKKSNSVRKTLPGSTIVGPGGPAWPSQRDLDVDIIDVNSIGSLSSHDQDESNAHHQSSEFLPTSSHRTNGSSHGIPASTRVRTLVIVDPRCRETSNVTYDNTMVIATTEDDFEEYDVDEVSEYSPKTDVIQSDVLLHLCETVMSGCNATILGADSRSSNGSTVVLKSVVRSLLNSMSKGPTKGSMSVSIVKLNGESVTDLLVEKGEPKKLVVAISPIFGSCVHGVSSNRITTAAGFDSMLDAAFRRASRGDSGRDTGFIYCSIIVKLRVDGDVLVCSLGASFVGENVGIYNSVLDQSPLVPRALYHYSLGGPCFTVAVLSIAADETRANLMLSVQKRLGEVCNRPTNPGSIVKFIGGIRNDAEPTIRRNYEESKSKELKEILDRLKEMVKDAESLLKDFEKNEPKAYLSEQDKKEKEAEKTSTQNAPSTAGNDAKNSTTDASRIRSVICYGQDLRGGGSVAVQDNTVFVRTSEGAAMRFDSDEIITLDEQEQLHDSNIMNDVVQHFIKGHNTGIISAETSIRYAFSLRALRKIAYRILTVMGRTKASKTPVRGELELSMALIKDDISADLLPVEVDAMYHRFELENTPIKGPHIVGVASHLVQNHEDFDHFLSVGIDNVYPALETEDPGVMVVTMTLRQKVTKPREDVLVSSLIFTAVFDAVHHYTGVLEDDPNEPLDIFKAILGAPSETIALFGISDEDMNADILLNTLNEICKTQNLPSKPNSILALISDLKEGIAKMRERRDAAPEAEMNFITTRINAAERMLKDAEALMNYPFSEPPREFVPLGAKLL